MILSFIQCFCSVPVTLTYFSLGFYLSNFLVALEMCSFCYSFIPNPTPKFFLLYTWGGTKSPTIKIKVFKSSTAVSSCLFPPREGYYHFLYLLTVPEMSSYSSVFPVAPLICQRYFEISFPSQWPFYLLEGCWWNSSTLNAHRSFSLSSSPSFYIMKMP